MEAVLPLFYQLGQNIDNGDRGTARLAIARKSVEELTSIALRDCIYCRYPIVRRGDRNNYLNLNNLRICARAPKEFNSEQILIVS